MNEPITSNSKRVVLATRNAGKARELQKMLGNRFELLTLKDMDIPSPSEDGLTFVENALLKARHASRLAGLPAIADDSGLCVDALNGAPGIHSARYAGDNTTDALNNAKLLADLGGLPQEERTARFHCTLVYLRHAEDPEPVICQGIWYGRIVEEPKGENGFGYDPLFFADDTGCVSAELDAETKNKKSHRGKAVALLKDQIC
jgi:XTP/dITP diphosphohydrolase